MYFLIRNFCLSVIKITMISMIVATFSLGQAAELTPKQKLEIVETAKSKVDGKIISIKPKKKEGYPNCHTVKMLSKDQNFVILPIQCGE